MRQWLNFFPAKLRRRVELRESGQAMKVHKDAAINRRPTPDRVPYVGKKRNRSARRKRRERWNEVHIVATSMLAAKAAVRKKRGSKRGR